MNSLASFPSCGEARRISGDIAMMWAKSQVCAVAPEILRASPQD